MHGCDAEHTFVDVPLGTMVKQPETGELLADLVKDGQIYVAARGGGGGKGMRSHGFLVNVVSRRLSFSSGQAYAAEVK